MFNGTTESAQEAPATRESIQAQEAPATTDLTGMAKSTTHSQIEEEQDGPYAVSFSADFATPLSLFYRLSKDSDNGFLFESTEGDGRLARYSFLGVDPLLTVSFEDDSMVVNDLQIGTISVEPLINPVDNLRQILKDFSPQGHPLLDDCPFAGGLVGYLGYGATRFLERIPVQEADPTGVPSGHYGLYDSVVIFDHQYRRVTFFSQRGKEHVDALVERALEPVVLPPLALSSVSINQRILFDGVSGPFSKESFIDAVERCKEYVREGQVFQIVLSQRFALDCPAAPIDVYRALTATNPSPYAYFLKCPDYAYVGSSPETFVRCVDGTASLRAIAGTRPRGSSVEEDQKLELELKSSEKEMAEHHMLVDLGRNDLGRVAAAGTVKVGEIACLTKYTHVMHLATEVSARLAPGKDCFHVFESCFPAGTVSGAPKVRAMQLLSNLEPEQRGIYSGAVGYFDFEGNMDGAIAIRSVLIKDGVAHVNAGAGIVYDSEPEMEYEETRNKAKSVLQAVKIANHVAHSQGVTASESSRNEPARTSRNEPVAAPDGGAQQ